MKISNLTVWNYEINEVYKIRQKVQKSVKDKMIAMTRKGYGVAP